jgi:hypothetical protein
LQPALTIGGVSPTPEPPRRVGRPTASAVAVSAIVAMPPPAATFPPAAAAKTAAEMKPPQTATPTATPAPASVRSGDEAPAPKPPSAISRVELTIDSLRTYDLSRPIPVVVESLGERNYHAEMADLNISVSASNPSEIIITLKDRIAQVYDGLRILRHPDAEQARQLRILETYIVKTRRGWLDRR